MAETGASRNASPKTFPPWTWRSHGNVIYPCQLNYKLNFCSCFLRFPRQRFQIKVSYFTLVRLSCEKSVLYIFILGCNFSVCTSKQLSKSIKLIHKNAPLSVKYTGTVKWIIDFMVMTVITSGC